MIKLNNRKNIFVAGFVIVFFAIGSRAENINTLSGNELMKIIREKNGQAEPAYFELLAKRKPLQAAAEDVNKTPAPETPKTAIPEEKPPIATQPPKSVASNVSVNKPLPVKPPVTVTAEKAVNSPQDLLSLLPAETVFCVRVNNFDYTLGKIDGFLGGALPIPMGASMMARMQLAGLFGDPQLKNINTAGTFVFFGTILNTNKTDAVPSDNMFVGGLIPTANYDNLTAGNPSIEKADVNGVSKINTKSMNSQAQTILITKAANYVLVSSPEFYDKMVVAAKSIAEPKNNGFASAIDTAETEKAAKTPIWAFINVQKINQTFGPMISAQVEQAKMMMASGAINKPFAAAANDPNAIMNSEKMLQDIQSLSIAVVPEENVLKISETLTAIAGTKTAGMFTADNPDLLTIMNKLKATPTKTAAGDLADVTKLIPEASRADFVGKYNMMELFKLQKAMMPMAAPDSNVTEPQVDTSAKSALVYAVKVSGNQLKVDIALPKEHLMEISQASQKLIQPKTPPPTNGL